MAHFNVCSTLVNEESLKKAIVAYEYDLETQKNPLDTMLDMQKSLQVYLAKNKPGVCANPDEIKTAGQTVSWLREQKDCIDDEFRELLTSLGEMSRGEKEASAVWKKWKSRYSEAQSKLISDMSNEDQLEIKFEAIDIFHFVLNIFIGLGMDAEEIFALYYLKNAENFDRQHNGY